MLIFLVNNDFGHLLETSLEYFGPNKFSKVIDNTFIIFSYKFYNIIVEFSAFCGTSIQATIISTLENIEKNTIQFSLFRTQNSELRNLFNIIHVFMCAITLPYLNTLGVLNT